MSTNSGLKVETLYKMDTYSGTVKFYKAKNDFKVSQDVKTGTVIIIPYTHG